MVIPVSRPLVGKRSVIPPAPYAYSLVANQIECLYVLRIVGQHGRGCMGMGNSRDSWRWIPE